MSQPGIQIAGWEALSAQGIGSATFATATGQPSPAAGSDLPEGLACDEFPTNLRYRAAPFDAPSILGAKGIRTMDRTTLLALCTSQLLQERLADRHAVPLDRTGFVIGTSTGSIRSTSDFTRETLVQPRPFLVNPALFPNTVMNCAAGQCGIRFNAQSVNATISGGRLSGLLAFKYALQMLRRGYVDLLFTGSVEELCPQSAWAHRQLIAQGCRASVPLGEGCSMFALARTVEASAVAGGQPAAEIVALQYGRYFGHSHDTRDDAIAGIRACMTDALEQAGIGADAISACVLCGGPDLPNGDLELSVARALLPGRTRIDGPDFVERFGDTYSATFSLALAWLLARTTHEAGNRPAYGIVLATSEDGHAGCLIVRTRPAQGEQQ